MAIVSAFDVAAILIAGAAVSGYVNHRFLRLPPTSGTRAVALGSSLFVVRLEEVFPGVHLRESLEHF